MSEDNVQIRISNLTRSFREGDLRHDVLKNLTADFRRGETVALRGRSGSGKSTLLNLISGIDTPDMGEIEVAGMNITRMSERDRTLFRRKHIGFVYQAFNLVPTLTVSDNIRLVLELNGTDDKVAEQRIEYLLDAVELPDRGRSFPDVLSGGEQQRVAIARSVAHDPAILLADEPTGNLDDKTADRVLDLLDKLVRQMGGTMIIATHSAAVASRCDRVLELHSGQLIS
ncbi:MAG: ABC transporter ATP-binding protein [Proteobacteria bacterium]|nr:ABC transporter ATP-binding protein [Pseudomonadota bacterium]